MNTLRRLLFTILVVTLLVGALAMPASVAAAPPPHVQGTSVTLPYDPSTTGNFEISVEGVTLMIPAGAIAADAKGGDITLWVTVTDDGAIEVEIDSVLRRKDFVPGLVTLKFPEGVENAYEGFNNQNENKKVGEGATIYLDHFSRYSGWF